MPIRPHSIILASCKPECKPGFDLRERVESTSQAGQKDVESMSKAMAANLLKT